MFKSNVFRPSLALRPFRRAIHSRVIGIDLGTTNSAVAVVEGGHARILDDDGARTTPSVVAFPKNGGAVLVGTPAKRQAVVNPHNTFFATKRLIGRKFVDDEVQKDLKNTPYAVVPSESGDAWIATDSGRQYSPSHVSGFILEKMKAVAEQHLGKVEHAVVTVPAYFNDAQRQATKSLGLLAGLNVLRVINEPTAAALAYGIDKKQKDGIVAVFDLGGGTFDISILDIEDGVFEVRATNGNTHLGGEDFDILLLTNILEKFRTEHGIDLLLNREAVQRVREAAERAKIDLSHVTSTEINLPFITEDKHIHLTLTEDELDAMSLHLIEKTIDPVRRCVRDADLKLSDIDEVILVGGMTRMPKLRSVVASLFGKQPNMSVNPDEAVALGAAIQGAVLLGQIKNVVLLDVTPLSLGIETYGGLFSPLIPRNSPVPVHKEQVFSTAVDGQTGVEIRVYQGERSLVKDNKMIGAFKLSNIPRGPKGTPQIAVSFDIDADGIISVLATDKTPYPEDSEHFGKPNSVSIQVLAETFTEDEINTLLEESKRKADADAQLRNYVEHANRAEIICTDTDNAVKQFGQLMTEDELSTINKQVADIRVKVVDIRDNGVLHDPTVLNEQVNELQKVCLEAIKRVAVRQKESDNKE